MLYLRLHDSQKESTYYILTMHQLFKLTEAVDTYLQSIPFQDGSDVNAHFTGCFINHSCNWCIHIKEGKVC